MAHFLFYVEPYPIRNTFVHFRSILDNFKESLLRNTTAHTYSIYANGSTLAELTKQHAEYAPHFLAPTKDEDALFRSHFVDWYTQGITRWLELMRESELSEQYVQLICDLHARRPFDYIICWGTNYAVKKAARKLGIGFINMELGCSRPPYLDSLAADPHGVNGGAALAHASVDDLAAVESTSATDDLWFADPHHFTGYESVYAYTNCPPLLERAGKEKMAFIPLQLFDDANMLRYAPYNTVEEVVLDIAPKLTEAGYTCIFKEHPASHLRKGSNYANLKAKVTALGYDRVLWLTHLDRCIPNAKLYQLADLVITVNSSTGFEALLFDKPLVVLGEAVYKVAGLFPTLDDYLAGRFDAERYRTLAGKLRHFFLHDYLISKEDANRPDFFFPHLEFVGELSKQPHLTPKDIIEAYIARRRSLR